jgi:hypothetical protein
VVQKGHLFTQKSRFRWMKKRYSRKLWLRRFFYKRFLRKRNLVMQMSTLFTKWSYEYFLNFYSRYKTLGCIFINAYNGYTHGWRAYNIAILHTDITNFEPVSLYHKYSILYTGVYPNTVKWRFKGRKFKNNFRFSWPAPLKKQFRLWAYKKTYRSLYKFLIHFYGSKGLYNSNSFLSKNLALKWKFLSKLSQFMLLRKRLIHDTRHFFSEYLMFWQLRRRQRNRLLAIMKHHILIFSPKQIFGKNLMLRYGIFAPIHRRHRYNTYRLLKSRVSQSNDFLVGNKNIGLLWSNSWVSQ